MVTVPATTSMTVFEWHARLIERAAAFLAHALETTADDKLSWSPDCEGDAKARSALEQAGECIRTNTAFAGILRGETMPSRDPNAPPPPAPATVDEAKQGLMRSAKTLADTIRGMTDADLQKTFKTPFAELPGAALLEIAHANMHYHAGQINYIQLMCGDPEFHVPPSFMEF